MCLGRRHDEVLLVIAWDAPHRRHAGCVADRRRELVERHPLLRQTHGIGHDLDLPHVAPQHVHAPDARHARQNRLDLIARDVVQRRRIATLHIVGQDREQRWRHALHLDVHAGGQVGHDLVHARTDFLQRVDHLGRGREVHADLGATPDAPGPDAGDARDDAGCLFDRPGHTEQLLARAERRAGGDDRDAGKVELGINGRGEGRRRPQAGDAQQRHEQVDEAALATQEVEQRHRATDGLRTMCAPSATPYAPLVTTISPAWSPDRTSTVDSLRPPTETDRAWATDPESTTNTWKPSPSGTGTSAATGTVTARGTMAVTIRANTDSPIRRRRPGRRTWTRTATARETESTAAPTPLTTPAASWSPCAASPALSATESPSASSAASAGDTLHTMSSAAGSAIWTSGWLASTEAPSTAVMRVTTPARAASCPGRGVTVPMARTARANGRAVAAAVCAATVAAAEADSSAEARPRQEMAAATSASGARERPLMARLRMRSRAAAPRRRR